MLFNLFRKRPDPGPVFALYHAIVAQARQHRFYADWGVPDTVTGRFDMVSLHTALVFRALRSDDSEVRAFAQALFDVFFKDMDQALREMGASDMGVPKKIQKMGKLFYGLLGHLNGPLDARNAEAVRAVIGKNVLADADEAHVALLADYLLAQDAHLAALGQRRIMSGEGALWTPTS